MVSLKQNWYTNKAKEVQWWLLLEWVYLAKDLIMIVIMKLIMIMIKLPYSKTPFRMGERIYKSFHSNLTMT